MANYVIGQAASDQDKKAGDSSGKEVLKSTFKYVDSTTSPLNWTYVFRPKDAAKAEKAAQMCEKAIANNNIGYSRTGETAYGKDKAMSKLAKAVNYDLSKITVKCGLSCGDLICLCNHYAGLSTCYIGSGLQLANELKKNKNFDCITYTKGMKLYRGDTLITAHSNGKNNHVVMVLKGEQTMAKRIGEIAEEVLEGKWGSGDARKKKLIEAGYDYDAIQLRINELLSVGSKVLEACKVQADWMKNYVYEWESGPTIEKSKKKGTCVTYVSCVCQRVGYLKSGTAIWCDGNGYGNGHIRNATDRMDVIYMGNQTLAQCRSKLRMGDVICVDDNKSGKTGNGGHFFVVTGEWSAAGEPYIWDNQSCNRVRQGKAGKHTYSKTRKVLAIIRMIPKLTISVDELAHEVLDGKWGSGDARKRKLTAVGYDYEAVQARVNELLNPKKTIDELAHEVLEGKWGSGDERKRRLTAAGYDYDAVQARVNELLDVKKHYAGELPTMQIVKTNAEVIADAIKWAKWIAADNDFHYGYTNAAKGANAHHNGCYFCGTQRLKKNMLMPEHTYCCNPFIGAAWAHGGCEPAALKLCQKTNSWNFTKGTGYDKSKLFTNLGHPAKSSLKAGDVLCKDTHVAMYIGNGKLIEAGSGDDNKKYSSKWNNSIRIRDLTDARYNNFLRVHRYNSSVNTSMYIRHGEVSKRVALWQAFLDWWFDGQVGSADGYYGDNTLKWTKKFQEEVIGKGEGDGIIGPKTLEAAKNCEK